MKNGSIQSFFKPVQRASQSSQQSESGQDHQASPIPLRLPVTRQVRPGAPAAQKPSPLTSSPPSSSPPGDVTSSPEAEEDGRNPEPAARSHNATIAASDDEGSDSDSSMSLPDFAAFQPAGQTRKSPVPGPAARREADPCVTPRAKRTAVARPRPSPVPVKSTFGLKALRAHAARDDAVQAKVERALELQRLAEEEEAAEAAALAAATASPVKAKKASKTEVRPKSLADAMADMLPEAEDEEQEAKQAKLVRAVKRTEAAMPPKRWYFFEYDANGPVAAGSPFPKKAVAKTSKFHLWQVLAEPRSRAHMLESGMAMDMRTKGISLPDELVLWIMERIGVESSPLLASKYAELLGRCTEEVRKVVDEPRVRQLFESLGAAPEATDFTAELNSIEELSDPYPGRDWAPLKHVLLMLTHIAPALDLKVVTTAMQILLRLGIDPLILEAQDIHQQYKEAIYALISSVPLEAWDNFCEDICTSLFACTDDQSLRYSAILALGSESVWHRDLRRRLAGAFVFGSPHRARQHSDDLFNMHAFTEQLNDGSFLVDPKTEYHELAAMAYMLTIALDDGASSMGFADKEAEKQYNADVDEFGRQIKKIGASIIDNGAAYISRLEAKQAFQDLHRFLPYTVRSHPPSKSLIFDDLDDRPDPSEVRQQAFMKNYFNNRKTLPVTPPS